MHRRVINTAVGVSLLPYWRIGGRRAIEPPFLTRVQTDGSYGRPLGPRIAAVVRAPDGREVAAQMVALPGALSSTEAEWASVAFGCRLALDNDHERLGIENDNLGVVQALMWPTTPLRHAYARHYRDIIYKLTAQSHWSGIRWIPRELNQADALF